MTSADQHYANPADNSELLGATHAWRAVLRQASANLAGMTDQAEDRPTRVALRDVVTHLNQACTLLTTVDITLDRNVAEARRRHCGADLAARAAPHRGTSG